MAFLDKFARRIGVLEYLGVWNADTNTPALSANAGQKGGYYVVSVAGSTSLGAAPELGVWNPGDWAIFNGTAWEKIDNTDLVVSVAGRTGAVTLTSSDVGLGNVDNTSDVNKPVSTAQQQAIDKAAYYFAIVL